MSNVVRFTLSTARNLDVPGAGFFLAGVLDVDANHLDHVARVRYLVQPYRAVEVGIVDSATPPPSLPAVPASPNPDPYPQYVTDADLANPASGPLAALRTALVPTASRVRTPGRRWAFAGDSITFGSGASPGELRFVTRTEEIAGSAYADAKVNAGVSGDTSGMLLARFGAVLAADVDGVVVTIGTNDTISTAAFIANIASMYVATVASGKTFVVCTVPPRSGSGAANTRLQAYNTALRLWAQINRVPLADTYTALADPATGFFASGFDSGDGTHPSNAGHLAMAKAVAARIRALPGTADPGMTASTLSAAGRVPNPTMQGSGSPAGWSIKLGSVSPTVSLSAPSPGDGVLAGNWVNLALGPGTSGFYHYGIDLTGTFAAGDVLLVCAKFKFSTAGIADGFSIALANNNSIFAFPLFRGGGVANPGPMMKTVTVPASPGALDIRFPVGALEGTSSAAEVNVFNLTELGLTAYA